MAEKMRRSRPGGAAAAQREADEPGRTPPQAQDQATPTADALDPALLGDSHTWHSANAPARTAAILQLQRTHGNAYARRAVQALQERAAAGSLAVQRDGPVPADTGTKAPTKWLARVRVEAAEQGTITFDAYSVNLAVPAPANSKKPEGQSLEVVKEIGPESAQLRRALLRGEVIKSVTVEVLRTNDQGQQEVAHTITLRDALVVSIRQSAPSNLDSRHDDAREVESVHFATSPAPEPEKPEGK